MIKFNEKTCDKIFVVVYIICFCTVSIYMSYTGKSDDESPPRTEPIPEEPIQKEPNCKLKNYLIELINNGTKCFADEEKDVRREAGEDNKMVIHISILLLQTSLIWTIVDFVDRYLKNGRKKTERPPLDRTCSLADITLMRHQRRESMRKEHSVDSGPGRFPGRSFDSARRYSLPIGPREPNPRKDSIDVSSLLQRRMTINNLPEAPIAFEHKRSHMRLLHRH